MSCRCNSFSNQWSVVFMELIFCPSFSVVRIWVTYLTTGHDLLASATAWTLHPSNSSRKVKCFCDHWLEWLEWFLWNASCILNLKNCSVEQSFGIAQTSAGMIFSTLEIFSSYTHFCMTRWLFTKNNVIIIMLNCFAVAPGTTWPLRRRVLSKSLVIISILQ